MISPKGHQAKLQPLHEHHQTNHDRKQTACNDGGVHHWRLQNEILKQAKIKCQRHHSPRLVHEPGRQVRLQNFQDIATAKFHLGHRLRVFIPVTIEKGFRH